jgi:hypothetical protein
VKNPLLSLAPDELRALSAAFRAGRLTVPVSPLSVQRFIADGRTEQVSNELEVLAASGMSSDGIAACLELISRSFESRPALEDVVDLVTTGPEAGGVANRSTAVVVGDLFRNANISVLIAGYAIHQGQKIFRALAEQMNQNPALDVRMFLDVPRQQGDSSSANNKIARFVHDFKTSHWPSETRFPCVYCSQRLIQGEKGRPGALHAKCVVVDGKQAFISSANFTEAGHNRNIEVGVLLNSPAIAERLERFFKALVDCGFFVQAL